MIKLDKCFIIPKAFNDMTKGYSHGLNPDKLLDVDGRSACLYVTDNEPLVRSIADNEEVDHYYRIESDRSVHKVRTYTRYKDVCLGTLVIAMPNEYNFVSETNHNNGEVLVTSYTLRK
jgi:CRISPR/Cas system-associated endonuclease/helicase Cas3